MTRARRPDALSPTSPAGSTSGSTPTCGPAQLAPPLLRWFRASARDLPWRHQRTPYRVWVSEVMLQQTQVDTVLAYYERFLARFPDVASLAAAEEEEVLAAWSGLGFYRRARNLHRAARVVVAEHGGALPRDRRALAALPGLGRYTVGALLSLAWGERAPILDGNVARVLARVFRVAGPPQRGPTHRRLWALAEAVLPAREVGAFNEALMELGALVCRPRGPDCGACPLRSLCGGAADGEPERYPEPAPRAEVPVVRRAALYLQRADGRFLVQQRPGEGLLASMYELPSAELTPGEAAEQAAARLARRLGCRARLRACGVAEHRFSHRHWTTEVFRARTRARAVRGSGRWVDAAELKTLALPTASRKVVDLARRTR